jgi:hypothetical protein
MHWKRWFRTGSLVLCLLAVALSTVWALEYRFTLDRNLSHVIVNQDGSADIEYWLTFTCDSGAHPIDIVDVGLPNRSYDLDSARAAFISPSGVESPLTDIYASQVVNTGVEVHLQEHTIQPGETGTLYLRVNVGEMVYPDTEDETYASLEFIPHYYESPYVHGTTDLEVHLYFPPGVTPEETRYHEREYDETDLVDDRLVFIYTEPEASSTQAYRYGISFPASAVETVHKAPVVVGGSGSGSGGSVASWINAIPNCGCTGMFFVFVIGIMGWSVFWNKRRRMKYLPPALSVEGVGIKRGLTAVEAAILLERPLNKVLTMMMFSLLKKRALTVLSEDPLRLEPVSPRPEGKLRAYEEAFLDSIKPDGSLNEKNLQAALVKLVKEVNTKMKGFSRKETVTYYKSIVNRAWDQVEAATTPEIKSRYFDQGLEWMMMDDDFEKQSTRTLGDGPVLMPPWWAYYRPWVPMVRGSRGATSPAQGSGRSTAGRGSSSQGGRQITLPTLPGAAFASTVVGGIERSADGVVSRLESFTGGVTQSTHPAPKSTSSSSRSTSHRSGGCACACACACAGCACACAGGGR